MKFIKNKLCLTTPITTELKGQFLAKYIWAIKVHTTHHLM